MTSPTLSKFIFQFSRLPAGFEPGVCVSDVGIVSKSMAKNKVTNLSKSKKIKQLFAIFSFTDFITFTGCYLSFWQNIAAVSQFCNFHVYRSSELPTRGFSVTTPEFPNLLKLL
jgi:hypothetical protein